MVSEVVSNSLRGCVSAFVSGILLSVIVSCIACIMASQFRPLVGYLYISLLHQMCHVPKRGSFLIISAFCIQVFFNLCLYQVHGRTQQGRIQELGAGGGGEGGGGGGTDEGVAGGGAKLEAELPWGGCGRGAPLPSS